MLEPENAEDRITRTRDFSAHPGPREGHPLVGPSLLRAPHSRGEAFMTTKPTKRLWQTRSRSGCVVFPAEGHARRAVSARGAAAPSPTAHPQLNRDRPLRNGGRNRKDAAALSMLRPQISTKHATKLLGVRGIIDNPG